MAEKKVKTRLQLKHDVEANWLLATNFVPLAGEMIVYDIDDNHSYERFKIGDGIKTVNELPFTINAHNHIYYGVCSTAAGTAAKTVDIDDFVLSTGTIVAVKFTNANDASNPTLNVSGTGAKPMYRYGTTALSTGTTSTGWYAKSVQVFIYDGTGWIRDYWNNTTYSNVSLGHGYATCSTAAATAAKTATLSSYSLSTGGIVAVKFTNAVTSTSSTLNINSKGAKAIYFKGAAIGTDVIKAGDIATFMYSGQYHLLSIDRWQTDIVSHTHTVTHSPAGTISTPTFTGTAGNTTSISGTETVSAPDHTHNFTPAGTVSQPVFTGAEDTLSIDYTPVGTNSTPTFTGTQATISASYTPAGTNSTPTFTGTKATLSTDYTPEGTVSQPTFTGTSVTTGSPSATATASNVTSLGTLPSLSFSVANKCLTCTFSQGTLASKTDVTIPTSSHTHTVIAAGSVSRPTFTGEEAQLGFEYTPVGTVSKPTFTGTTATISTTYTPAGTVSKPTFTGTKATLEIDYTPAGSVSQPIFTGTNAEILQSDDTITVASSEHTHGYTPAGTVSQPTFTGTSATLTTSEASS